MLISVERGANNGYKKVVRLIFLRKETLLPAVYNLFIQRSFAEIKETDTNNAAREDRVFVKDLRDKRLSKHYIDP